MNIFDKGLLKELLEYSSITGKVPIQPDPNAAGSVAGAVVGIDYNPTITWKSKNKLGWLTEVIAWPDGRTVEVSAEDVPEDMTLEDYCDRVKEAIDATGMIFNGHLGGTVVLKNGIVEAKSPYITVVDPHAIDGDIDKHLLSAKGVVVTKPRSYGLRGVVE